MSSDAAQGPTDEQKSALVERILCGEISAEEACRERGLSESELKEWVSAHRRIARRTQEERLSAALSARGLPHDDVPIGEFSGSLESLALAELIQTIEYGRKDAQIRVDHDGAQSHIWCQEGQVVDARSGPLAGAAAVYRLLSLRHGRVYARFVRTERTLEGKDFYRTTDLKLVRDRLQLARSWNVLHVVDEASPFFGTTPAALEADGAEVLVTVTGLDDTWMQTVHATHRYAASQIAWGYRLADVISEEGTVMTLDLTRFHELERTEPLPTFPYPRR